MEWSNTNFDVVKLQLAYMMFDLINADKFQEKSDDWKNTDSEAYALKQAVVITKIFNKLPCPSSN